MTREQGHAILDQVKDGLPVDDERLLLALIATGDLAGWKDEYRDGNLASGLRGEVLDDVIQNAESQVREVSSEGVVGKNKKRLAAKKRPTKA